jgi:anthranilate 1,2-dioxygenase small subunit
MNTSTSAVPPELKQAVIQLYEDYAEVLDRLDIDTWPQFFSDDCKYMVTARENYDAGLPHAAIYCDGIGMVRDRVASTRDCTVYEPRHLRHFINAVRVKPGKVDGTLDATASFLVVESISDKEPHMLLVGQYIDTIVQEPDGLKLKERYCVYDNYRIYNTLVFPV